MHITLLFITLSINNMHYKLVIYILEYNTLLDLSGYVPIMLFDLIIMHFEHLTIPIKCFCSNFFYNLLYFFTTIIIN